ncbi:hypothetical protein [Paenibacillus sp. NAIST15-1]|uniref:defense against restriction DarA-related protein n=1 Tax=Paenibacillus sp. NAIST15-1 TaxID=1605994 RepID=UPI0008692263|nr:hypothetical protein [Paenibacillus sp. NAIST15-1]GAV11307.1 hypothetical protein PBN151_1234 [Paenibacillus sp. NAIST15-1]
MNNNATYSNGTWKKGLGTELELIYIIETTKFDEEVDRDFTNIKRYERNNIQEAIDLINQFQQHGYKNINLMTQINHNGDTILEDSSETGIEFAVNTSINKDYNEVNKQKELLMNNEKLFNGFIEKYKAEKAFIEFKDEQANNRDEQGLHWYEMLLRPLSPYCQPNGHIKYDETKGRHGIIAYDRELTANELEEYELRKWIL